MISEEKINEIRRSIDIVDVVSEYLPLTKKGKNFFGVCPFHDDHSPSMSVSPEKQIYTCFSCGATGNVFKFIMDYENISFVDTLKKLADKANINVDIKNYQHKKIVDQDYFDIYDISHKLYINNINTKSGKIAKDYLNNRGITDEAIKQFDIGYASSNNDVSNLLRKKNYSNNALFDSGLVKDDHDFFYNRIMIPISDPSGKIIAYTARIISGDGPKYINTNETKVFKKTNTLYNYHRAKEQARKTKSLIIMEGPFDVIRASSIGYNNSVATLGTAFTKEHMNIIKKTAKKVYLSFDSDAAGIKATISAGTLLESSNIKVYVMNLKDLDPDDFIVKYKKEGFEKSIDNAVSFSEYKMNYLKNNTDFKNDKEVSAYINKILSSIDKNDDIIFNLTLNRLSNDTGLDIEFLKSKIKNKEIKKIVNKKTKRLDKYEKAERLFLHYMFYNKQLIRTYQKRVLAMPSAECRFLANEIISFYNEFKMINLSDLLTYIGDKPDLINLINEIERLEESIEYNEDIVEDCIKVLIEHTKNKTISKYKELMVRELDFDKKQEYAEKIRELNIEEDINEGN